MAQETSPFDVNHISVPSPLVGQIEPSENDPLLPGPIPRPRTMIANLRRSRTRTQFFSPSPMWMIPFFLIASISRGMTLAPRVEVLTSLACEALQPVSSSDSFHSTHSSVLTFLGNDNRPNPAANRAVAAVFDPSTISSLLLHYRRFSALDNEDEDLPLVPSNDTNVLRRFPKAHCFTNSKVQQQAAQLQMIVTLVMGVLTALTTGRWGTAGDRIGRTKVMAISLVGCLFTDFVFLVVGRNAQLLVPFGGQYLIVIGPIVEGLLGGWSTLLSAVNAYVSDTTAHGSRSHIYSQVQGLLYVGIALGPALGSVLIKHNNSDTLIVFYAAVAISLLNFVFAILVIPESLTDDIRKELTIKRQSMDQAALDSLEDRWGGSTMQGVTALVSPLGLFIPKGKDWRITYVGMAFFTFMLTIGLYPLKLLYAEHAFKWNAVDLGQYLTYIGTARAVHLLFILPLLIKLFKPAAKRSQPSSSGQTSAESSPRSSQGSLPPTPSRANLTSEIRFDLHLARISMGVDTLGYVLVALTSTPQAFLLATGLSAFGSGATAAIQSLALCFSPNPREDTGRMFGALSIIQTVGATIVSPLLFGLMYSTTVSVFPKAIFVSGAALLFTSIILLILVRPRKRKILRRLPERGRSTKAKVLWGSSAYSV